MLKIFRGLFLGLVVLVGSACVTPTHVSSAFSAPQSSIVITYIQASGLMGARDEAVVLFNTTEQEVDITHWCLMNKAQVEFACFAPSSMTAKMVLPAKTHVAVVSKQYAERVGDIAKTMMVFEPTHATSGSITSSADTMKLLDANKAIQSEYVWSTALASGKAYFRAESSSELLEYSLTGTSDDWFVGPISETLPSSLVVEQEIIVENPGEDDEPATEHPVVTELLPNATGLDTGYEFIELHNPSQVQEIVLSSYKIKIADKSYALPAGSKLMPGEFKAFYNDDVRFTLPNSSGKVQLLFNDQPIGSLIEYDMPAEGESWSLVGEVWAYTTHPSPHNKNEITLPPPAASVTKEVADTEPKPCAANQYRHPETNRCRKIVAEVLPTPCKVGQERNKDTGRCRNVTVAGVQSSCKAGQERNPETNRCRNIEKMTNAPHGIGVVKQESSQGSSWYMWVAIAGIAVAIVSYGVWEWRQELLKMWTQLRKNIGRKSK